LITQLFANTATKNLMIKAILISIVDDWKFKQAKISTNETTTKDETTTKKETVKTSKDETQEPSTTSLQPVKTENLINLYDLKDFVMVTNYNETHYKQELKDYKNRNPFIVLDAKLVYQFKLI